MSPREGEGGGRYPMLERLRTMPRPAVARLVDFHLTVIDTGEAVVELETDERHFNPMGTVHGGILCDIADAAMGVAFATLMGAGETYTTVELKINYLKPVFRSKLTARGRVVRKGRTIGLVECDITDERGSLVARASSTCMLLEGEQARGR